MRRGAGDQVVMSQVKGEAKAARKAVEAGGWRRNAVAATFVPLISNFPALVLACLVLSACGRGEQPTVSNAATPPPQMAGSPVGSHPPVATALVQLGVWEQ